jgi:hypothetical protein
VPKLSVTLLAVLLAGVVGYLAYDPSAAKSAVNWTRRQLNIGGSDLKPMGTPNYMPVTPAKGL